VFVVILQFSNANALDHHLKGVVERSKKPFTFIEPFSIERSGEPNPATSENMKKIAGSDVTMSISPNYVDGFLR
jgi:hypothetical protein